MSRSQQLPANPSTSSGEQQAACVSIRSLKQRIGHDWLVDTQPADSSSTTIGMVLSRNVASGVQVSIEMIPTLPTFEDALGTAVGAGTMPTAATCLRGMSRVNRNHRTTPFLGFVPDKALELGERPGVHSALGFGTPFGLHSPSDVLEVFQHDRSSRLNSLNDLLGEYMIAVAAEASLSVAEELEMPFCAACAFLLQCSLEMKQPTFDCLPRLLAQEAVAARHSGTADTQIDANDLISRLDLWGRNRNDDMQPPMPIPLNQIGGIGGITRILGAEGGNTKTDRLPPAHKRHTHGLAFPIDPVGVNVVARRAGKRAWLTDLPASASERERAFDCLGGFDARLHMQVTHQGRIVGFDRIVQRTVQLDPVLLAPLPAIGAHSVKDRRKLAAGFCEHGSLGRRRLKSDTDRALHMNSIPYIAHLCQKNWLPVASPGRANATVPAP